MRKSGRTSSGLGRVDSHGYRTDIVEEVSRLLSNRTDVTRGKMFGFPAFYTAGRLFACVYGDGVGLKLPQDTARRLEGKPGITPFQPYGNSKMREWIHLRHDRATNYSKDAGLFEDSIRFVGRAAASGRGPRGTKHLGRPASR